MGRRSAVRNSLVGKWGFLLFAVLVLSVLLIVYFGVYYDHRVVHRSPLMLSQSHFLHFATAEATFDQGHYRYLPDYLDMGFEKGQPHFAPGVAHLPALIAYATGIPVYDAVELVFPLLFIAIIVPFFALFSSVRWEVRALALAMLPLLFEANFVYGIGAAAGYGFILGAYLFVTFLLLWYTPALRNPLLLGLSLGGIMIAHPPEIFFAALFIAAVVLDDLIRTRFAAAHVLHALKLWGITIAIFLLTVSAYILPFAISPLWEIGGNPLEYRFTSIGPEESNPQIWVSLEHFPWSILLFLCIGFLLVLCKPFPQKFTLLFFVLLSNLNYVGFLPTLDVRGFQYRFIWPITLAIFFGFGVYTTIRLLAAGWSRWNRRAVSESGVLLLSLGIGVGVFLLLVGQRQFGAGMRNLAITEEQYLAFQWLETHAEPDADILFLYLDGRNTNHIALKRFHAEIPVQEMVRTLETNFSALPIRTMVPPENFGPQVIWNNSWFQFIEAQWEQRAAELDNRTICDFDYYLLDTYSELGERGGDQLIGFNAKFLQRAAERGVVQITYRNSRTLIVKNTRRGEPCV